MERSALRRIVWNSLVYLATMLQLKLIDYDNNFWGFRKP
ncbi:unnamed protein product, partial [Didymodactylos carnosus]